MAPNFTRRTWICNVKKDLTFIRKIIKCALLFITSETFSTKFGIRFFSVGFQRCAGIIRKCLLGLWFAGVWWIADETSDERSRTICSSVVWAENERKSAEKWFRISTIAINKPYAGLSQFLISRRTLIPVCTLQSEHKAALEGNDDHSDQIPFTAFGRLSAGHGEQVPSMHHWL